MLDEEMDDIIRDASNQYYPAYDDKAWSKMERLLDKHLPKKENKRKYLLFLLLFLLADAGLFIILFYPKKNNSSQPETIAQKSKQDISNTKPVFNEHVHDVATDSKNLQMILSPVTKTKGKFNDESIA